VVRVLGTDEFTCTKFSSTRRLIRTREFVIELITRVLLFDTVPEQFVRGHHAQITVQCADLQHESFVQCADFYSLSVRFECDGFEGDLPLFEQNC
jgi:hypothetical protein